MRRLSIVLAGLGLALSAYLEVLHVRAYLAPGESSVCALGARLDCDAVALSGPSVLLGVPLALWGIVGWATILVAAFRRPALVFPLAAVAAAAGVVYTIVSWITVRSFCLFCEAAHLVAFVVVATSWRERGDARALLADKRTLPFLAVPLLALVAVRLFVPRYFTIASWGSGIALAHGTDEEGRPWIGAKHPALEVHEYIDYYCPHCRVAHGRMRMRVAAHPDALRIVRHQTPRMTCAPPRKATRGNRCLAARIAVCAGRQGKFWEMDDWLVGHAPDGHARIDVARATREVGVDRPRLERCLTDRATWEAAERDVREAKSRGIRATPAYVIDGKRMTHPEADREIDRRL